MNALSYAWSAAAAVDGGASYRQWAEWIWQGEVAQVITSLVDHQEHLGPASGDAVLHLRTDSLSDSQPLSRFWNRRQSQQTGSNHYQTAA